MTNLKLINQSEADKKLHEFIKHLSEIEIKYDKVPESVRITIKDSGLTVFLYTICFMKMAMQIPDKEIIAQLEINTKFYDYLQDLLKDEFKRIDEITLFYVSELKKINPNLKQTEISNYMINFYVQGQEYLRKHFYPEDSPYKNIDNIENLDIFTTVDTNKLGKDFNKSMNKVEKLVEKHNQDINKWNDPKFHTEKGIATLASNSLELFGKICDEYDEVTDMVALFLKKYEVFEVLNTSMMDYIEERKLIDDFEQYVKEEVEKANISKIIKKPSVIKKTNKPKK